jgi:hypothetical protein
MMPVHQVVRDSGLIERGLSNPAQRLLVLRFRCRATSCVSSGIYPGREEGVRPGREEGLPGRADG